MDNPWVWLFGSLLLIGVTNGLTFLRARAHYSEERRDRVLDEQEREQRALWMKYIADTRDRMLSTLEIAEVIATGNVFRAIELAKSGVAAGPTSMNELVADPDLVSELTTTLVEVIERGWGASNDAQWNRRLAHIGDIIRTAFRDQEQRVAAGEPPLLVGPQEVERMNGAMDRLMAALDTRLNS